MMFGLLVEYISVPKANIDRNKYKNPVGAQQFLEWREQAKEDQTFSVDYRRDKRALKLISQTEWEVRRRLANSPALTLTLTTAIFARAGRSSVLRGRGLAQGRRARQGPGPHAGRAPVVAARDERPLRRGAALEQLRPVSSHSNIAPHQSSSSPPAVLVVPEAHAQIFDRSGVLCVSAGACSRTRWDGECVAIPTRTRPRPHRTSSHAQVSDDDGLGDHLRAPRADQARPAAHHRPRNARLGRRRHLRHRAHLLVVHRGANDLRVPSARLLLRFARSDSNSTPQRRSRQTHARRHRAHLLHAVAHGQALSGLVRLASNILPSQPTSP